MCCALIISGVWGPSARSGGGGDVGIPHEQLECRTSFKVIEASRSLSRDSRAYRADNDERILFFDPDVYFRQPPVVGALEFAKSCLTLTQATLVFVFVNFLICTLIWVFYIMYLISVMIGKNFYFDLFAPILFNPSLLCPSQDTRTEC